MPKRNGAGIELLADPTRRRIIAAVAIRPRRPSSLATELGLSRPAVTRQLTLLLEAGLVERRRSWIDSRVLLYRVASDRHGQITAWLAGTEIARPTTTPPEPPPPEPPPPETRPPAKEPPETPPTETQPPETPPTETPPPERSPPDPSSDSSTMVPL